MFKTSAQLAAMLRKAGYADKSDIEITRARNGSPAEVVARSPEAAEIVRKVFGSLVTLRIGNGYSFHCFAQSGSARLDCETAKLIAANCD